MLKRVFDIERCPHCGGQLKLIAALEEPAATACAGGAAGSVSGGVGTKPDWILRGPRIVSAPPMCATAQTNNIERVILGWLVRYAEMRWAANTIYHPPPRTGV